MSEKTDKNEGQKIIKKRNLGRYYWIALLTLPPAILIWASGIIPAAGFMDPAVWVKNYGFIFIIFLANALFLFCMRMMHHAQERKELIRRINHFDPNIPPEILEKLAKEYIQRSDIDWEIVKNILRRKNIPPNVLSILSLKRKQCIDEIIAAHPKTPPELLTKLAKRAYYINCTGRDIGPGTFYIQDTVVLNPNTSPETLADIIEDYIKHFVPGTAEKALYKIQYNPKVLLILSKRNDLEIDQFIAPYLRMKGMT